MLFVFSLIVAVPAFGKKDKIRHYPVGGIKGWYVVMLPAETEPQAFHGTVQSLASTYQLNVTSTWERFKGFLAEAPIEAVERLANDARVASIEQDHFGEAPPSISGSIYTQPSGADLWFLDRLDELTWAAQDNTYDMCPIGGAENPAQSSVTAYVLDFPVWAQHDAFNGRVTLNVNCASTSGCQIDTANSCRGVQNGNTWTNDPNWQVLDHGTNVASILSGGASSVAGTYNTGAARPEIISVQAISCESGAQSRFSFYVNSLDYIWTHWYLYRRNKPVLVNHSGFFYPWLHSYAYQRDAHGNLVRDQYGNPVIISSENHLDPNTGFSKRVRDFVTGTGIPYFTSADNWGANACQFSPNDLAYTGTGSTGVVFVVGGTGKPGAGQSDSRWDGGLDTKGLPFASNGGACVSAWAPAAPIRVASHTTGGVVSTTAYESNAGTSFSAPLAAGLVARWMHERHDAGYGRPWYTEAYDFLLSSNQYAPVPTNTAVAGYPVCVAPGTADWRKPNSSEIAAGSCFYGYSWHHIQGAAASTARMIHWGRTCP